MMIPKAKLAEPSANSYKAKPHTLVIDGNIAVADTVAMVLNSDGFELGATGIGAFYDDEVHRHLNLTPKQGQVVYHFAIGYPVTDPRISA